MIILDGPGARSSNFESHLWSGVQTTLTKVLISVIYSISPLLFQVELELVNLRC